MTTIYPSNYDQLLADYDRHVAELEAQREVFYRENPDFPNKNMFMNVLSKPCAFIIIEE